jgi:hypothetical protein
MKEEGKFLEKVSFMKGLLYIMVCHEAGADLE